MHSTRLSSQDRFGLRRRMAPAFATALLVACSLGWTSGTGSAADQPAPASSAAPGVETLAAKQCASCHGPRGLSADPGIPQIAGQQRDYLEVQLRAFRAKNRADPAAHDTMWKVAATLDDETISALADYYAALPAAKGRFGARDAARIARGRRLYGSGDRSHSSPACAACHGIEAEGQSVVPRLAGQHATYLRAQIEAIQSQMRKSPVMHGMIRDMSLADIEALSDYLESI